MKKLMMAILPFLLMQDDKPDEEKKPIREQLFVQALGLPDEVQKALQDGDKDITEVVGQFKQSFGGILKQTHLQNWEEEKKSALVKETQTGSHAAFQSKLLKAFDMDADAFKDVDKKTEAILQAAQKKYAEQITELKTKLDGKTDASTKQLQEQLDLRNNEYNTLNSELEELRKLKEQLPTIKQGIIQQERDRAWVAEQVAQAVDKIPNKNAAASLNLINLLLSQTAKIEVQHDDKGGRNILIKNAVTDAPYMRTETDNYKDLGQFIRSEILERNKLINLQNPPSDQTAKPIINTNGQSGKKANTIHPNAQV